MLQKTGKHFCNTNRNRTKAGLNLSLPIIAPLKTLITSFEILCRLYTLTREWLRLQGSTNSCILTSFSKGFTLLSFHVRQEQLYFSPVQAIDLQTKVSLPSFVEAPSLSSVVATNRIGISQVHKIRLFRSSKCTSSFVVKGWGRGG